MKISDNTILITGGTSGIGYELAAQFLALGNTVIVTGRDRSKLEAARLGLPGLHTVQSDVSNRTSITELHRELVNEFPDLNVLINNAGIMRKINLLACATDLQDIDRELATNLTGSIQMTLQFLPHLRSQPSAAIVNVSSGLAFVPLPIAPIYSASKAAMHSFTRSLRVQLKRTNITVFELAPPITRTSLFKDGLSIDEAGVKPMDVKVLARLAIGGIKQDHLEIRPGLSNMLSIMSRIAPNLILNRLGRSADRMLAA